MTDDGWQTLGALVRKRREHLGLKQGDLAQYGGPGVSTVGKIERGEQGSYPRRTRQQVEVALGWRRGMVDEILAAPASSWWSDEGMREDFLDSLVNDEIPDLTHPAMGVGLVRRAAKLTDDELLAELTFRMKRYANERIGESGGDTAPMYSAGDDPATAEAVAVDSDAESAPDLAGRGPQPSPRRRRARRDG